MLDHYYTPRDAPHPLMHDFDFDHVAGKPLPLPGGPRAAVVDLSTLDLEHLAFDCDSGSESGSDDGYVSTLQRMQRTLPPAAAPARKIAGARRVARAVSAPRAPRAVLAMEVEVENVSASASASASTTEGRLGSTPEGEVFQSITAIPGLESTSFEELRLETYLQSLVATGTARPQPAFAPALVIPPAFSAPFCDWDRDAARGDVEMPPASPPTQAPPEHPPLPPAFRAASWSS